MSPPSYLENSPKRAFYRLSKHSGMVFFGELFFSFCGGHAFEL